MALLALVTCTLPSDLDRERDRVSFFAASPSAVTMVGAGDISTCTNTGDSQTASLVQGVLATDPSATVFTLGDNAYPGVAGDYTNCYDPTWGAFKSKTRPAIGNHEYEEDIPDAHFDYWNGVGNTTGPAGTRGEGWYSYDVGKWHVVVLNTNVLYVGTRTGSPQETWLRADLAATGQPCIMAYFHHARFFSGTVDPLPDPSTYHLDFWNDLIAAGADLVLSGHAHVYERYAPQTATGVLDMAQGLRQIIVGTGGASGGDITVVRTNAQAVDGRTFGVLKLTLDDGRYAWEFLPVAGKTFTDRGVGLCHGSPEPTGNAAPSADFSYNCSGGTSCAFIDASADPDGSVVEWGWTFGDGASSVARNPTHVYAAAGTYSVRLTAVDDDGVMRSKPISVTTGTASSGPPPNQAPTAAFTQTCNGLTCTFTDASTDFDGTVTGWSWTFGDGGTSTAKSPTRTYAAAGTYTVALTVTDDDGAPATTSKPVPVSTSSTPLSLRVTPTQDATKQYNTLDWTGATGVSVDVYKNGAFGIATENDGHYTNSRSFTAAATYTYKICLTGSAICSNDVTTVFGGTSPTVAPTANFTASCSGLSCAFSDGSSDSDGTVTKWNWTFGDGSSSTLQNPTRAYAAGGTYTVKLVATDNANATGTVSKPVTVTAPAANVLPTADFIYTCTTGGDCTFTDRSTDSDGTVTGWSWTFGDGATSIAQDPTHTYAAGQYNVTLTATDNRGGTGSKTQQVTVTPPGNQAPVPHFSASCTGVTCSFTDASTDDVGVTGWSWDFGDDVTSTDKNPSHTFPAEDSYDVTLTVSDVEGLTGTTTQLVSVLPPPPNTAPTAAFLVSCSNLACTFTDQSTDNGSITKWEWDFGDGSTSSTQSPTRSYAAAGTYTVKLKVTDNDPTTPLTGETTKSVTVTTPPANAAPTAKFTSSCTNLACTFTDQSTDDGSITKWSWTFGDGGTSAVRNPSRTYATGGTYTVNLTVTDNATPGLTGTVSHSVTVAPAPNVLPTANFTSSCSGLTCSFTDASTDSDGSIATWAWTFGDGATSTTKSPSRTYAAAGTYTVTLNVTDNRGGTNQKSASVTVTQSSIVLTVKGSTDATKQYMTLDWTGARGANVDVYKNGVFGISTPNDGHYVNSRSFVGPATYTYKVCETGTTICSNNATVVFK